MNWVSGDWRGQSGTVGFTLLLLITVVSAGTIVTVASPALTEYQSAATLETAERSMTTLDSRSSLVAFGDSDAQTVRIVGNPGAVREVDETAGWFRVSIEDPSTGTETVEVVNTTLGAVVYRDGDTAIAYQGGGVWKRGESGSVMVAPPEVHYRGRTLSVPLITVTGDGYTDDEVVVRPGGAGTVEYPDAVGGLMNPVDGGIIVITVNSEFYEAWGTFLVQRTGGTVEYDHAASTARVELFAPSGVNFDNVVLSTAPGGVTSNGGPAPAPYREGVEHPSPDWMIETAVAKCESGVCNESVASNTLVGSQTYYLDGAYSGDLTVDTSDGNVTLVINGSFAPDTVTITGDGSFTVFVRENFDISGGDSVNDGGPAKNARIVVHSDGDVTFDGNYRFVGFLYAPESHITLNGGGGPNKVNVYGAIISETIVINGEPNKFQYERSVVEMDFEVAESAAPRLTYLHVSVTPIHVADD